MPVFPQLPVIPSLVVVCGLVTIWRLWRKIAVKSPSKTIRGPASPSWLSGNLLQLNDPDGIRFTYSLLDDYGGAAKIHGVLGDEQIYFSDPLAIRHIIITDHSVFSESSLFIAINKLQFGEALTASLGVDHKRQRRILNPVFSSSHIRALVPVMLEIASRISRIIEESITQSKTEINMLDLMWRTSIDIIGEAGLGHSFDSIDATGSNTYIETIRQLFPSLQKLGLAALSLPVLRQIGTPEFRRKVVEIFPWKVVQDYRKQVDILNQHSHDVLLKRRSALAAEETTTPTSETIGQAKDAVTLLLRANASEIPKNRLSEEEVIAQINLLIFAASDTTSRSMSKVIEELAKHPVLQDTLRNEVTQAILEYPGSSLDDKINELGYLDAVIKETLRLYPPVVKMERTALQAATVPLHIPITGTDGRLITRVPIAKNQTVVVGIANCNRDPRLWGPDSEDWKPDRWLKPFPESLVEARIPGVAPNILSFLGGERGCLGYGFALMEMKVVILTLISKFRFELPDGGPPVVWKLGATQYPTVAGFGEPRLPIKVTLLSDAR